jgi:hypothetical protein
MSNVEQAEAALPIDEMVAAAVGACAVEDFRFPVLEYAVARHRNPGT